MPSIAGTIKGAFETVGYRAFCWFSKHFPNVAAKVRPNTAAHFLSAFVIAWASIEWAIYLFAYNNPLLLLDAIFSSGITVIVIVLFARTGFYTITTWDEYGHVVFGYPLPRVAEPAYIEPEEADYDEDEESDEDEDYEEEDWDEEDPDEEPDEEDEIEDVHKEPEPVIGSQTPKLLKAAFQFPVFVETPPQETEGPTAAELLERAREKHEAKKQEALGEAQVSPEVVEKDPA
jgi:hypothetical protein